MCGIGADDHDFAMALDDSALIAHRFYGRSYLHKLIPPIVGCTLLGAPGDTSFGKVVRRHLDRHSVSCQDPDVVHPQFPGDMCVNDMPVLQFHFECGVGEHFVIMYFFPFSKVVA